MMNFSLSPQHEGKLPTINRGVHKTFKLLKLNSSSENAHNSQRESKQPSSQQETGTVMMANATET